MSQWSVDGRKHKQNTNVQGNSAEQEKEIMSRHNVLSVTLVAFVIFTKPTESTSKADHSEQVEDRIISGTQVTTETYPWLVSMQRWIENGWVALCSGTIIDSLFVITAAHCLMSHYITEYRLGLHKNNLALREPGEFYVKAAKFMIAPGYHHHRPDQRLDLGMILLQKPLKFDRIHLGIHPLRVPDMNRLDDFINVACEFAGWGRTSQNFPGMADVLQKTLLKPQSNKKCNNTLLAHADVLSAKEFCCITASDTAGYPSYGDSGGPLVCKLNGQPYFLGVLAAMSHSLPRMPIFTNLAIVAHWIHKTRSWRAFLSYIYLYIYTLPVFEDNNM